MSSSVDAFVGVRLVFLRQGASSHVWASGAAGQADTWSIVGRTSAAEAHLATALDLRDLSLQDVEEIVSCKALRVCLLGSNLLSQVGMALFSCRRLRKLDLSNNGLTTLPPKEHWAKLDELQILYLHDNQMAALPAAGELIGCPMLLRLTLHGNPLSRHPSYRHYCVNTLITLKALDLHVISDEELIERHLFGDLCVRRLRASDLRAESAAAGRRAERRGAAGARAGRDPRAQRHPAPSPPSSRCKPRARRALAGV